MHGQHTFALDDLGVTFRKESIRLKIKCPRPQIFFPGGILTPYINPPGKNTCYPPSTSFEALYLKIALDNMPFALDDLGVIFCKESIALKKNFFQTSNIFSRGWFLTPYFWPPEKSTCYPLSISFSALYSAFWDVYIAPSMHFLHRKGVYILFGMYTSRYHGCAALFVLPIWYLMSRWGLGPKVCMHQFGCGMNWIKGYYMIVKVKNETFWFSTYSMEMHSLRGGLGSENGELLLPQWKWDSAIIKICRVFSFKYFLFDQKWIFRSGDMIDHSQEVYAKVDQSRQKYTISLYFCM